MANIDQVFAGSVAFGVTRSDYLVQAVNGTRIWQDDRQPMLTALFSVHSDALFPVVREGSDIRLVYDLKGRAVSPGILDSVDQQTATQLLERSRFDVGEDIDGRSLLPDEAAAALVASEIDAFFVVGTTPASAIEQASDQIDIRVVALNTPDGNAQVADAPHYQTTDIHTTYDSDLDPTDELFRTTSLRSFGDDATVITRADMPEEIVSDVAGYVLRHLDELCGNNHPYFSHLEASDMRDNLLAPGHPGVSGDWSKPASEPSDEFLLILLVQSSGLTLRAYGAHSPSWERDGHEMPWPERIARAILASWIVAPGTSKRGHFTMRKLLLSTVAAALVAVGSLAATPAKAQTARDLLIGGGSVTGVYYQVALHVCNLVNQHSGGTYNCVGRPALGSVFNINAVNRGLLDFGVAQSDRNWQAANGSADWDGSPVEQLRSVFSVHPETVLLVTRDDTGISSVDDLRGRAVNIGNPGSGQRGNAEDILRLYGVDANADISAEGLQQNEASRALIDQKIDAFFYTVGNPAAAIEEPANSTDIKIIPIDSQAIRDFIADKPYYVMTEIQPGTYKGVDEPVATYAVKATVVASMALEDQVVYDVVKIVMENLDELREAHAAFRHLEPEDMLQGLSAPFHPGAEQYYKEQGWM
ncbi:MAG: TAXI family TRAP transporter solute-binding subunit [Rhodospirillales bacterium]|nr:TAXI family TRAP transporter solute-binding subunit [Rhodospirillales bacterium]